MLLAILVHENLAFAVDKIRIGIPDFTSQFATLPLAQKRGFFQEEGLEAEVIRINATVGFAALANGEIDYYPSIGPGVAAALPGSADQGCRLLRSQRSLRSDRPT